MLRRGLTGGVYRPATLFHAFNFYLFFRHSAIGDNEVSLVESTVSLMSATCFSASLLFVVGGQVSVSRLRALAVCIIVEEINGI